MSVRRKLTRVTRGKCAEERAPAGESVAAPTPGEASSAAVGQGSQETASPAGVCEAQLCRACLVGQPL